MPPANLVRVYVPSTLTRLRDVITSGGVRRTPFGAHAVTEALRSACPDGTEEDWEYAASSAAAQTSIGLLREGDEMRRAVVAVDASSVVPVESDDPTTVEVGDVVPFRQVAAALVDDVGASNDVTSAVHAWAAAATGDAGAVGTVERCLDHELGWYATQEIGDLLGG